MEVVEAPDGEDDEDELAGSTTVRVAELLDVVDDHLGGAAEGGGGLGMLKAARLLRIFKIIKSWESLKVLLGAVLGSMDAITNLGILIFLFLFIFALFCKQFFAEPLLDGGWGGGDGDEARYAFGDTYTAIITIFIVLTGENWNEVMILSISNT